ncbi:MAG: exosortase/archaeosortase family protein [Candidatus Omnitrophota bacterium]
MTITRAKLIILAALLIVIFLQVFHWMNLRFSEPDSFYAHGFLIPFVVGYLVFSKKEEIKSVKPHSQKNGLFILIISLLIHVFAGFFEINFLSGFALIGVLCGLVIYNCGFEIIRLISFPLFFISFMVPIPKVMTLGISFYMKIFAANAATALIGLVIPLKSAGSMVYLPNGVLTVGAPCSGLKSLITLTALSLLFAHLTGFSLKKKILFFIGTIPIALIANIIRIMLLILVFYVYGSEVAMGKFHDISGFLLFVIAFVGLVLLRKLFLLWEEKN